MKKIYTLNIIFFIFIFAGCQTQSNVYIPDYWTKSKAQNNYSKKLKPYKVLGVWYYPKPVYVGEVFQGIASWYGPDFHGKLTANGEIYDMYAYTAANKIMPMNTKVRVINLNNGKSVVVRINDRGPFVKGRILDLSYAAGKAIGIDKTGTAPVKIIVLSSPETKKTIPKYTNYTPKTNIYTPYKNNYQIQIGAFEHKSGAYNFKKKYSSFNKPTFVRIIDGKYKVFIGGFSTYNQAKQFLINNQIQGFITKDAK
jgi:rare lipoprotein A